MTGQGNVLECLKSLAHNKMSANCRAVVFEEEQEEVLVMGVDHQLLMGCKHEIKSHCPEQNEVNGLLNCLKEAMEEPDFDRGCKMIVNKRVIQHTKDYRYTLSSFQCFNSLILKFQFSGYDHVFKKPVRWT